MYILSVWGMVAPDSAMDMMTGLSREWDPETLSLMRMHNGADFGVGTGFLLVAFRPQASFAAFVLCVVGNICHGIVHLLDEVQGHHHPHNLIPLAVLFVWAIVLCALYPWAEGFKTWNAGGLSK